MSQNIILKPNPFSSYFTLQIDGRPTESFHFSDIQGTDSEGNDYYDDKDEPLNIFESPIDGKLFKLKIIEFDMEHWSEEETSDFYAEWNTNIDSIHVIQD